METNPRGYALVINNEQFKSMSERTGSRKDMENLHDLFKLLGFDMCHYVNKTAEVGKVCVCVCVCVCGCGCLCGCICSYE